MTKKPNYVDVTDRFFEGAGTIETGKVVHIPDFDMLEGALALEIGNERLDTGLIKLSEEELTFDSSKGQTLARVTATMDKILVLCMTWLKGLSLLVTVLSCRYVLDILSNYKEKKLVKYATFVNSRLHLEGYKVPDDTQSQYVNVVLRAFVLGMVKFIGFGLKTGREVLYEEEDMVTKTLDLDFLTDSPTHVVLEEIEGAVRWLSSSSDAKRDPKFIQAMYYLRFAKNLILFENVMDLEVRLFKPVQLGPLQIVKQAFAVLGLLVKNEHDETVPFAFSTFAQLDQNNNNNPSKIKVMDRTLAYESWTRLFQTVDKIVSRMSALENYTQLEQFLTRDVGHDIAVNDCALARGIFQRFFIRDDSSIAGLPETVSSVSLLAMEHISLCASSIMDPALWNLLKTFNAEAKKEECMTRLVDLFHDIESATYHELSVNGNNRCRQRQLRNRNIVILDTLQHKAETMEVDFFHYGIGSSLPMESGELPALEISSFLYYRKLETMIDVVLSGFELDLYQASEAAMMFLLASDLASYANVHLSTRIIEINRAKRAYIASFQTKFQRTKPGEKLETLKERYRYMKTECLPILESNINFIEKFAVLEKTALQDICTGIAIVILLVTARSGSSRSNDSFLVNQEKLYNLRMKPWSSVGSPPTPSYEDYRETVRFLDDLNEETYLSTSAHARDMLQAGISRLEELLRNLRTDANLRKRLITGDDKGIEDWCRKLQATAKLYEKQLSSEKTTTRMKRTDLLLPYFPMFSTEEVDSEVLKQVLA